MLRSSALVVAIWLVFPDVPGLGGAPVAHRSIGSARAEATANAELAAEELSARVLELLANKPGEAARGPLEHAKLALAQARAARNNDAHEAEQRNLSIARAALALAEARIALLRERALLASAQARNSRSRERAEQSRLLLERARARLAADGVAP